MKNFQEVLKDYQNSDKFVKVVAEVLPIIFRDDEIQKMIDVGFDSVSLNEYQFGMLGEKVYEKVIEVLEETPLTIRYQLWKGWQEKYGIERALNYDFSKHPKIDRMSLFDEPTTPEIDRVKNIIFSVQDKFPNMILTSNLYPCYVPESVIESTYEEHVKKFFEDVVSKQKYRYVSCDYYPFMQLKDGRKVMMDTWAYNYFLFAKLAKKHDATLEWCIQTCNYDLHRVVDEQDMLLQIYLSLAFGVVGLLCFTYATPLLNPDFQDGGEGMIGNNFQPTSMYYATQSAIKELRKIEKVYMDFKWDGTKTFIGSENVNGTRKDFDYMKGQLNDFARLNNVKCSQDTIISQMIDKKHNRYGYVVVNYNDPILNLSDRVRFDLQNSESCIVFIKGQPVEFVGKVDFTLNRGEGALVVICE